MRWKQVLVLLIILVATVAACGGGDEAAAVQGGGDQGSTTTAPGLATPADYPLPIPAGGTVTRSLVDPDSGSTNIAVGYASGSFDSLVSEYDGFFATTSGETEKVGPSDGLVSWQNETLGYSVVVNDQATGPVVALQTGV